MDRIEVKYFQTSVGALIDVNVRHTEDLAESFQVGASRCDVHMFGDVAGWREIHRLLGIELERLDVETTPAPEPVPVEEVAHA